MKVLLDQGVPAPLRRFLSTHEVHTAFDLGWSTLKNGALLAEAKQALFNVFVTTDKNIQFQYNISQIEIAIVVLPTTSWPVLRKATGAISEAIDGAVTPGIVLVDLD